MVRTLIQSQKIGFIAIGLTTVLLAIRLLMFVDDYAVDIPYWDQWDFLTPFFQEADLWNRVVFQHGPHRQGLGALLLSVLYPLTHWNIRAECYVAAVTLILTCGCYLGVKWRLTRSWALTDIAIPLLVLSLLQSELFVGVPNPSHGPLPALLISLVALSLTVSHVVVRGLLVAGLSVVSTYTGFAFFNGLILPCWLVLECYKCWLNGGPKSAVVGLLVASISASVGTGFFFVEYVYRPAIACFVFPHTKPVEYVEFMALMMGRAFGSSSFGLIQGLTPEKWPLVVIEGLGVLVAWAWSLGRALRGSSGRGESVILYLASFSLLFGAMTAIGRVCGGMVFTMSSRYVPYMVPGILALYLATTIALPSGYLRKISVGLLLGILVLKEVRFDTDDDEFIKIRDGKKAWAECYLGHKDVGLCHKSTGFKIHPSDDPAFLQMRLDYLEMNKLSFLRSLIPSD